MLGEGPIGLREQPRPRMFKHRLMAESDLELVADYDAVGYERIDKGLAVLESYCRTPELLLLRQRFRKLVDQIELTLVAKLPLPEVVQHLLVACEDIGLVGFPVAPQKHVKVLWRLKNRPKLLRPLCGSSDSLSRYFRLHRLPRWQLEFNRFRSQAVKSNVVAELEVPTRTHDVYTPKVAAAPNEVEDRVQTRGTEVGEIGKSVQLIDDQEERTVLGGRRNALLHAVRQTKSLG
jgi:hypothetical protein